MSRQRPCSNVATNPCEGAAEELVFDDRALGHAAILVKGPSGKGHALKPKRHAPHAPALSSLATALFRTSDFEAAKDAANQAIAHNPFDPQPHCILSKLAVPQADHEGTLCSKLGGMRE